MFQRYSDVPPSALQFGIVSFSETKTKASVEININLNFKLKTEEDFLGVTLYFGRLKIFSLALSNLVSLLRLLQRYR